MFKKLISRRNAEKKINAARDLFAGVTFTDYESIDAFMKNNGFNHTESDTFNNGSVDIGFDTFDTHFDVMIVDMETGIESEWFSVKRAA